jgi:glycerol-1-phosphate dehydrogenase [NAD(P)+]
MVIADVNTFAAAGRDVLDSLRSSGHPCARPFVFEDSNLRPEYTHVKAIERALVRHNAIAVAVGSGTINDLAKLASHNAGRPYLVVATAASMDGYSAFGASIMREGSKQTINCPAPVGILADLNVVEAAPEGMSASGYADLLAKTAAGADWLVADALGVESIDPTAWQLIHPRVRAWVSDPEGIRRVDPAALRSLILGLIMSGFAMQHTSTSRPASGAEHQFSHLWDMQHHAHQGRAPFHGLQVGIGTLASTALYEQLFSQCLDQLDIDALSAEWPDLRTVERDIRGRFNSPALTDKALEETRAKHISSKQIREQLVDLRTAWPQLRDRLRSHLMSFAEVKDRLHAAGSPCEPQQIGISPVRLRASYRQAYYIRRRFTVLDLAMRTGLLLPSLQQIFSRTKHWVVKENPPNDRAGDH